MKKAILTILLLAASLAATAGDLGTLKPGARFAPGSAHAPSAADVEALSRAAQKASFHTVAYLDGQSQLSTFTVGYASALNPEMSLPNASGYAGTGIDTDFYYCDFNQNSTGGITAVNWRRVDVANKTLVSTQAQTTANAVCMDMTYDVATGTIYGMSAMADVIVTVDPATGRAEYAFETLPFYTLSADAGGQLYGILMESGGKAALYTVNKMNGSASKVGDTGVTMLSSGGYGYFQTASFSRVDGRLYWLSPSASGTDLYRVDPGTGRASLLCTLGTMEALCLFDIPGAVEAGAPAPVSAPAAVYKGGSEVEISFTAPASTASGEALSQLASIDIYRGSATEPTLRQTSPTPGQTYILTDTDVPSGSQAYRFVAVNDAGESQPLYAAVYVGADYPNAPVEVHAQVDAAGYPELSWSAPGNQGVNGGYIDTATLTYNIYRDSNGTPELIFEGVNATTIADGSIGLDRQSYPVYYITAVNQGNESVKSAPAGVLVGPAYGLPFEEAFEDGNPATAPWTMQSLALGGAWELGIVSNAPGTGPYVGAGMLIFKGFIGVAEGAEARIVTPKLSLPASGAELRFHFFHADFGDDMHFDDHMIVEVSANNGEFEALEGADLYQYTSNSRWTEYVFPLDKYAGCDNARIGFHGISAAGMDLVVDNIRVLPKASGLDGVAADAPVEYYNLQGLRVANPGRGIYLRRQGAKVEKVLR